MPPSQASNLMLSPSLGVPFLRRIKDFRLHGPCVVVDILRALISDVCSLLSLGVELVFVTTRWGFRGFAPKVFDGFGRAFVVSRYFQSLGIGRVQAFAIPTLPVVERHASYRSARAALFSCRGEKAYFAVCSFERLYAQVVPRSTQRHQAVPTCFD